MINVQMIIKLKVLFRDTAPRYITSMLHTWEPVVFILYSIDI